MAPTRLDLARAARHDGGLAQLHSLRIYECLPLRCPKCGEPMRIIAFVLDRPTIERILDHIGEPTQPPKVLPARSPPQLAFGFDQTVATTDWPEMDQTAGTDDGWD